LNEVTHIFTLFKHLSTHGVHKCLHLCLHTWLHSCDIVSLAQKASIWDQKLTHYVSFWIQKIKKLVNFCSNGFVLFLLNLYLIQSMFKLAFFLFLFARILEKLLRPETDEMHQFLGPETDPHHQFLGPEIMRLILKISGARNWQKCVSFWVKKLLKWVSTVSGPRNWHYRREILYDSCIHTWLH
jgi:hypothetical protein